MSENPYSAPKTEVLTENNYEGDNPLYKMDFKALQKLYYRSHNVSSIAGLMVLGVILIAFLTFKATDQDMHLNPFLLVLMVFYIVTIVGLILRSAWGRILGIIVCILSLFNLPLGTIIGIMGLFAFFKAPELFGDDRITHKDIKAVWKERKKTKT